MGSNACDSSAVLNQSLLQQIVTALLMVQSEHWIRATRRADNVRANRQFADEVVTNVRMDRLIYSAVACSVVKIVDATLVARLIRFVTKEPVNVNAIPE